jgi:hypothetical protein
MAAPDLIKCIPKFFFNPSFASPIAPTASCNALITYWEVAYLMISLLETVETGEYLEVPGYFLTIFTIAVAALTGQVSSPDAIWVMVSIILSLFCLSKVTETQSAYFSLGWL